MDLQEICTRPNNSEYTEEEMAFVVERYIMATKGQEVKVNIKKGIDPKDKMAPLRYLDQLKKLIAGFNDAEAYWKKHYSN